MFCVTVLRTAVTGPAGCAAWAQNLTPRGPIPLCYTITKSITIGDLERRLP